MRFLEKIDKYIHRNNLLHPEDLYIVALSGGADSVALLLVLKQLGYKVEAAHCNFNLRGEESIRDEQFCVSLCEKQNVPLHRIHFDTKAYAALHKVSIEMAARELRYQYFENLRKDICAKGICVAHHEDDNVETILLNIIRGTGLKGLTGIAPKNGNIIRPLLCITRSDIIAYLESVQQNYVVDSTNLVDDVKRNKIRLNLLPMLEEMNPSVKSNIASMARYLAEAEKITNMSMDGFWKRKADIVTYLPDETASFDSALDTSARISIQHIMDFFSPEYLLFHILKNYGFNGIQVEQICEEMNSDVQGKSWQSATHELIIDRGYLVVERIQQVNDLCFKIPETGNYVVNDNRRIKLLVYDKSASFSVSKEPSVATLDADKVVFPLTLRATKQGDRFVPFGMKGSKLVSDFLTDIKFNVFEKRSQLVLVDSTDTIIWLPNLRVSNSCAVSNATKHILEISI